MSIVKVIILVSFTLLAITNVSAEEVKKVLKNKDWEAYVVKNETSKICFAQSIPILQAPKSNIREARLFVTFRPNEKISDEISITSGYEYNKKNSVMAKSGKYKYKFDISQENFAWIADNKIELKMIRVMKKASRIMITGYNKSGCKTIDHYSLMGFTNAYTSATKSST